MANIRYRPIPRVETGKTGSSNLYKDVKFDIKIGNDKDIDVITDAEAVRSSIVNILQTTTGSRLLNPSMDVGLQQFLFATLSKEMGYLIGTLLINKIEMYEPRVRCENVDISVNYDDDCYVISMDISIPSLGTIINLNGILDRNEGFSI